MQKRTDISKIRIVGAGIISCLLFTTIAGGERVVVEPQSFAKKLQLTVLQNGKPMPNVDVEFYQAGKVEKICYPYKWQRYCD